MQIYLDDCADDDDLISFLSQAGHMVYTPRSEGTLGTSDDRHLEHAAARGLTLLTQNPADFRELHNGWRAQGHGHSGSTSPGRLPCERANGPLVASSEVRMPDRRPGFSASGLSVHPT